MLPQSLRRCNAWKAFINLLFSASDAVFQIATRWRRCKTHEKNTARVTDRRWDFLSSPSSFSSQGCIGVRYTCFLCGSSFAEMFYCNKWLQKTHGERPTTRSAGIVASPRCGLCGECADFFPRGAAVRQHLCRVTHHYRNHWTRYVCNSDHLYVLYLRAFKRLPLCKNLTVCV